MEKEYNIILLNFSKGKTKNGNDYGRLGYCFTDVSDSKNYIGVREEVLFISIDPFKFFEKKNVFKEYILRGELVSDFKNPLNQRFVPKSIFDIKANYEISVLEKKQD